MAGFGCPPRPTEPPQRHNLLLLAWIQGVARRDGGGRSPSSPSMSRPYGIRKWPVLSIHGGG